MIPLQEAKFIENHFKQTTKAKKPNLKPNPVAQRHVDGEKAILGHVVRMGTVGTVRNQQSRIRVHRALQAGHATVPLALAIHVHYETIKDLWFSATFGKN